MRTSLTLALTILFFHSSFSQEDSTTKKGGTFKFDLSYLSNNVYLGRKDSSTLSYLTPGVFYVAPSGFFASGSFSFLTQQHRIDAGTLQAGYDYSKGAFDANLSGSKYFFSNQSVNVKSSLSATLDAYLSYETPYVTPVLNTSISFGNNQPDYFAGLGLEHSFYAASDALIITPSFTANGSTQHFYDGYYKFRRNKKKTGAVTLNATQEVDDASAFKILDYELSTDFSYKVKRVSFYVTPTYAIATNPNVIVTTVYRPNGAVLSSQAKTETLSNSFYCTVGLSYKLSLK